MRGASRRHAWLRACFCDAHALHTPTSSVVSKHETTRGNSLRRHPSLTPPSAGVNTSATFAHNSVGNTTLATSTNTYNSNGLSGSNVRLTGHHHQYNNNTTMATDTIVTTAATSPLHHAHMANVVAAHHHLNNNDHHLRHHLAPKHSHSSSSYSDLVLVERSNNFSAPTSPSLSSSPTSSSASELNASFCAPHQDSIHHPSYQNYLAFRAQQLNAAQIYASPPGTPLSQLYDTAGPAVPPTLGSRETVPIEEDLHYNSHNVYQACHPPSSPHLYLEPQAYPRPSMYTREMMKSGSPPNSSDLTAALSTMGQSNSTRTISSSALQNFQNSSQNVPKRLTNSHSAGDSPEDNDHYFPISHESRNCVRGHQTKLNQVNQSGFREQDNCPFQFNGANHLVHLVRNQKSGKGNSLHANEISHTLQHLPNNLRRTAAS